MKNIKVSIGSLNPTKIEAVKLAFGKYFNNISYFEAKVESRVSNQPIGIEEILKGAKNRAEAAINFISKENDGNSILFGVGIEAGLVEIPLTLSNYMDFQFCVILDIKNILTIGSGVAFEYPKSVIERILVEKDLEIGDIMGDLAGNPNLKNETGAISFLSKNLMTRANILTQAVICALLPRINPDLYG